MPYTQREQIIVDHVRSEFALNQMRIADGTASLISQSPELMSGGDADSSKGKGLVDAMSGGAKEVTDVALQQTFRWVQAKPIFEKINADLAAQGYPALADNEKGYLVNALLPDTTPPAKPLEWAIDKLDDIYFGIKDAYYKKHYGIEGFNDGPEDVGNAAAAPDDAAADPDTTPWGGDPFGPSREEVYGQVREADPNPAASPASDAVTEDTDYDTSVDTWLPGDQPISQGPLTESLNSAGEWLADKVSAAGEAVLDTIFPAARADDLPPGQTGLPSEANPTPLPSETGAPPAAPAEDPDSPAPSEETLYADNEYANPGFPITSHPAKAVGRVFNNLTR